MAVFGTSGTLDKGAGEGREASVPSWGAGGGVTSELYLTLRLKDLTAAATVQGHCTLAAAANPAGAQDCCCHGGLRLQMLQCRLFTHQLQQPLQHQLPEGHHSDTTDKSVLRAGDPLAHPKLCYWPDSFLTHTGFTLV